MNTISSISFGSRKLIPLSSYKGTILQLTEADKKQISGYQSQIASLELEKYKLEKLMKEQKLSAYDYFYNKLWHLDTMIEELLEQVKQVKLNRLELQKLAKKCV